MLDGNGTLREQVLRYVGLSRGVTFPDLLGALKGAGMNVDGTFGMVLPGNIVLWDGMSEEAADFIDELRLAPDGLTIDTVSPLIYLFDGATLNLPVVKRLPKNGYRRAHWLPVLLRRKADAVCEKGAA